MISAFFSQTEMKDIKPSLLYSLEEMPEFDLPEAKFLDVETEKFIASDEKIKTENGQSGNSDEKRSAHNSVIKREHSCRKTDNREYLDLDYIRSHGNSNFDRSPCDSKRFCFS